MKWDFAFGVLLLGKLLDFITTVIGMMWIPEIEEGNSVIINLSDQFGIVGANIIALVISVVVLHILFWSAAGAFKDYISKRYFIYTEIMFGGFYIIFALKNSALILQSI